MAKFLDSQGLAYLWQKIKAQLNNKADKSTIDALNKTISQMQTKISQLETALANKEDKVNTWGDLTK